MSSAAQSSRFAITNAIKTRLETLAGLTVYIGEVPDAPPLKTKDAGLDPSRRVAQYAVVYPSPGKPNISPSMEGDPSDFLWTGQIDFAGGFNEDVQLLLDDAVPLLDHWIVTVGGISCGFLRNVGDPGPIRINSVARPPRHWVPTQWQLHVA